MSTFEKLKIWLGLTEPPQAQNTVVVTDEIAATAQAALAKNPEADTKVMDIARLIASQEPMIWADVRAVVEFYWGGMLDPNDYGFIGDKGDGEALKWWETQLEKFEGEAIKTAPTTGFKVYRDNNDQPRWLGWVSNNWIDREKEIISAAAHREYIQWLDANPKEAPELWSWHTRGTARNSRADWWDYANGFLVMSGPLTEDEAKAYENLGERELGMSHGFYVLNQVGPVILKYRTFEVSDLDREYAANPYTTIEVIGENRKMFNPTKRAYLVQLFGEDEVAKIESITEDAEKALDKLGISRKDFDEKYLEYLEAEANANAQVKVDEQVDGLLEKIKEALNVEQLRDVLQGFAEDLEELRGVKDTVVSLQAEIEALKATEDQRIQSLFTPRKPLDWSVSAAQSKETVVDEEDLDDDVQEDIKQGREENSWLRGMAVR